MSTAKEYLSYTNLDFDNNYHIDKKKKAVDAKFHKKNHKDIVKMINDEDSEVSEKYARYIK